MDVFPLLISILISFLIQFQPDSTVHVHWKGAAEIVLGSCTHYMDENESPVDMSGDKVDH